jgi:hypothetical protein
VVVECQGSPLIACDGMEIINNALMLTRTRLRTELARPQVGTPPPLFFRASLQNLDSLEVTEGVSDRELAKY